ncbi:GMC oxidoreductase family protein [Pleurotus pulmonarius]
MHVPLKMQLKVLYLFASTLCFPSTLAKFYSKLQDLPERKWDFIVIGGGTAGCVVASRLTEDPSTSVLLIEAGKSNTGADTMPIQVPFLVSEAGFGSEFDWNYTTTPQSTLMNRKLQYPRGFVLGGSSSTNYMAYTRGSMNEYDRLAKITGDKGWSWDNIKHFIMQSEKNVAPTDKHNTTGQFNPLVHGFKGLLQTSLPGFANALDDRILQTTKLLQDEFPFNLDMNSGQTLGIGWLLSTIGNGTRSSAATAYLAPALSRPNLSILTQTRATRLEPLKTQRPDMRRVELAQTENGPRRTVTAEKEVILSAGSIGTPQLLMLSGIGDKKSLEQRKIETIVNLPDVGNNLQEHPFFNFQWRVNDTLTLDTFAENATAFTAALDQYESQGTGVMSSNSIANQIGFFRLPKDSSILKRFGDPTAGSSSPHYEFAFSNGFIGTEQIPPTTGNYFSTSIVLVSPTSVGNIRLSSRSVFTPPLINPQMLSTEFDKLTLVEAVRALQRFVSASPWRGYLLEPFDPAVKSSDPSVLINYMQKWIVSIRHPVGTARMSKDSDKDGVVGPDLLVKNTQNLRVIDASVIPKAVACHPQAVVYAIAERASSLIKLRYHLK